MNEISLESEVQMLNSSTINRNLVRDQLYEYLREQIGIGKMVPGNIINSKQLMKDLNVSQTPLREAFLKLQADGFVTVLPQRGVMINVLTWKDIKEIYEIIGGLESRVIISVFNKIGPDEINKMKKINEGMFSSGSMKNFSKYYDLNIAFHNIYLELSDNVRIVELINKHRSILFHFAKRDYGRKWEKENYDEHLELIKLFGQGNANKVADFIRDVHLTLKPEYRALVDNK